MTFLEVSNGQKWKCCQSVSVGRGRARGCLISVDLMKFARLRRQRSIARGDDIFLRVTNWIPTALGLTSDRVRIANHRTISEPRKKLEKKLADGLTTQAIVMRN